MSRELKEETFVAQKDQLQIYQELINSTPVDLDELNDRKNVAISNMGYLNFSDQELEKIKNGGLCLKDLEDAEKRQEYIDLGLGDLKVVHSVHDQETGFGALTIEDDAGNTGVVFRATDTNGITDAIEDIKEHVTGTNAQVEQASQYFREHADPNGQNHIYGYSLGALLVNHVYKDNHSDIEEAFCFKGPPLSGRYFDSQEIIDAFNDPKYQCYMVEGDFISMTKENLYYQDNVKIIANRNGLKGSEKDIGEMLSDGLDVAKKELGEIDLNFSSPDGVRDSISGAVNAFGSGVQSIADDLSVVVENISDPHMINAETYDENGNFVLTTREAMERNMEAAHGSTGKALTDILNKTSDMDLKLQQIPEKIKGFLQENIFERGSIPFSFDGNTIGDIVNQFKDGQSINLPNGLGKFGIGKSEMEMSTQEIGAIIDVVASGGFIAALTNKNVLACNFDVQDIAQQIGENLGFDMQEWVNRVQLSMQEFFGKEVTKEAQHGEERPVEEIDVDELMDSAEPPEIDIGSMLDQDNEINIDDLEQVFEIPSAALNVLEDKGLDDQEIERIR